MPGKSLRYLSLLMSQVVHQFSKKGSLRERLAVIAAEFVERLRGSQIDCETQIISTFHLLHQLMQFFDYYHEKKYQLALEILANTKLIPMWMNELDDCISNFKRLSGEICKVFPDVLLATMDILYSQYKDIKANDSGFPASGRDNVNMLQNICFLLNLKFSKKNFSSFLIFDLAIAIITSKG